MPLPDKTEVLRRFDSADQRLNAALAFSLLLADLQEDDDVRQLTEKARTALAELEEGRRALEVFVGRKAVAQVREAEITSAVLLSRLADRDNALAPSAMRRCLRQEPKREPQELASLLGFYLYFERGPEWTTDRVDKVDLLLTELSQQLGDSQDAKGTQRLNQILAASHPTSHSQISDVERRTFERNLQTIEEEVGAAESLGALIDSGTLKRYRKLKHRLGHLLLHPELLTMVIETNQGLQRKIRRLNSRTVTGIFSIYQGIFERGLKGSIDQELRQEIDQLHDDFDRFEKRVKQEEVRLTELEDFWTTLKDFSDRLEEEAAEEPEPEPPPVTTTDDTLLAGESTEGWLSEDLMALLDLLRENDRKGWPPEYVSFSPEEEFQLEPREIVAFRRLSEEETVDRALELFLLKAAALRRNIKRSARRLASVSDAEYSRELPVFDIARQAVQLAESYLASYSRAVEQAILDGDVAEAQQLQILRMRLVRESAGVWLQVYQPI